MEASQNEQLKIIEAHIKQLENESFRGWSEDAIKGYLTACVSIREFINDVVNGG